MAGYGSRIFIRFRCFVRTSAQRLKRTSSRVERSREELGSLAFLALRPQSRMRYSRQRGNEFDDCRFVYRRRYETFANISGSIHCHADGSCHLWRPAWRRWFYEGRKGTGEWRFVHRLCFRFTAPAMHELSLEWGLSTPG